MPHAFHAVFLEILNMIAGIALLDQISVLLFRLSNTVSFKKRHSGLAFNRRACGARQQGHSVAFRAKPCPGAVQKIWVLKEIAPGRIVLRAA